MATLDLYLAACLAPFAAYFTAKRYKPRHTWALTGLTFGLVSPALVTSAFIAAYHLRLNQLLTFLFISLMRLWLRVYLFPARALGHVADPGEGVAGAGDLGASVPEILIVAAFWGVLGGVVGHAIDSQRRTDGPPRRSSHPL